MKQEDIPFEACEYTDFDIFKRVYLRKHPTHTVTKAPQFESYDAIVSAPTGRKALVEFKGRGEKYRITTFKDMIIQVTKVDENRTKAKAMGYSLILCGIYPKSNAIALWDGFGSYGTREVTHKKWTVKATDEEITDLNYCLPFKDAHILYGDLSDFYQTITEYEQNFTATATNNLDNTNYYVTKTSL